MTKGIKRRFDKLGRIVVPIEMRRSMNLVEGEEVDIYFKDGEIRLKGKLQCCGCESTDKKLIQKHGILLCSDCIKDLYKEVAFDVRT